MIKVKVRTHDATRYLRLTVEGHAGSDTKGHDLVCASASILAAFLIFFVKSLQRYCKYTDNVRHIGKKNIPLCHNREKPS